MNHSFRDSDYHPDMEVPTLFLPGWGFDGRILRLLKPLPHWIYPETLLDPTSFEKDLLQFLAAKKIRKVRLIGWSMGAMLGLEFAARHRDLIASLVLVSLRACWPALEIQEIRAEFSREPEVFLKSFYRKCFLGDRQAYASFCAALEPQYLAAIKTKSEILQSGLDFLSSYKIPGQAPDIPTRLIHGRQDIIAPVKEMAAVPGADIEIIDNAGHSAFLHEDCSLQHALKKQVIQVKFSRAAESYDSYAKVQAEVAKRLAAKLPPAHNKPEIKTILEIGCGTGNFTALLADRFPGAKIVALDFSAEMLEKARHKLRGKTVEYVCAEGEQFLQEAHGGSFDLVASNGSLQWFSGIENALRNIARVLTTAGSMSCSIFGPQSLQELGKGLQAIQALPAGLVAQSFPQRQMLQKAMQNIFSEGTLEEEIIGKQYKSMHDLLLHIKKTGTAGWQQNMRQPLTPARMKRLDEWFARTHGSCRVTYQVLFLRGRK